MKTINDKKYKFIKGYLEEQQHKCYKYNRDTNLLCIEIVIVVLVVLVVSSMIWYIL